MKSWITDNKKLAAAIGAVVCIIFVFGVFAMFNSGKSAQLQQEADQSIYEMDQGSAGVEAPETASISNGADEGVWQETITKVEDKIANQGKSSSKKSASNTLNKSKPKPSNNTKPKPKPNTKPKPSVGPKPGPPGDPKPDPPLPPADELKPVTASASESQVVASVNEFRTFNGRDALIWSPLLGAVAKVLAKDISTASISSLDARASAIAKTTSLKLSSIFAIAGVGQPSSREVASFLEKVSRSKTAMLNQTNNAIAVSQYKGGKFGNYWVVLIAH